MKAMAKKSLIFRLLALVLIVGVLLGLTACGDKQEEQPQPKPQPLAGTTVDIYTTGGVKSVAEDGTIIVLYDNATFNWSPKDDTVGRTSDGWWAGIKISMPATGADVDKAVYSSKPDLSNPTSFKQNRDGDNYIGLWGLVNEDFLKREDFVQRGYFEYNRYYDWNGDGVVDAHVVLRIKTNCHLAPKPTGN